MKQWLWREPCHSRWPARLIRRTSGYFSDIHRGFAPLGVATNAYRFRAASRPMMSSSQPNSKRPSSGSIVDHAKMPTENALQPAFSIRRKSSSMTPGSCSHWSGFQSPPCRMRGKAGTIGG